MDMLKLLLRLSLYLLHIRYGHLSNLVTVKMSWAVRMQFWPEEKFDFFGQKQAAGPSTPNYDPDNDVNVYLLCPDELWSNSWKPTEST